MQVGIVGGGINGLCCAWQLARGGHAVRLFERDKLMQATSRASSKLLHGGLRYLENGEFRLVREALRERDAWLDRAPPGLTRPLRLVMPLYRQGRRSRWQVAAGLFLYDHLAGPSRLPKARWLDARDILKQDPALRADGLVGGYEFSDAQMDDYELGLWVARQAIQAGVEIAEGVEVTKVTPDGRIKTADGGEARFDRLVNIAGPWANRLLERSGLDSPYRLDPVRGSHLILDQPAPLAYLLEVPDERRIIFVLPWHGRTLVGTTEVRQTLDEPVECSPAEQAYLLAAYRHYRTGSETPLVFARYAGIRPLLYSSADPSRATREYALHRTDRLLTVLGGKWTTAPALASRISHSLH